MELPQPFLDEARADAPGARRFVSNRRDSVRMFRSDGMEALSKVSWWVPPLLYVPMIAALLVVSARLEGDSFSVVAGWFAAGLLVWTPAEYVLHRWVFHYQPRRAWAQRLHFIFHGVHHDYPNDARRLVMPPSASLPIALAFYGLFALLLSDSSLHSFFAGFLTGYLIYDLMHYAFHHAAWRTPVFAWLKRNHMQHHFVDPTRRYGVSSPLWDWIFGSRSRS